MTKNKSGGLLRCPKCEHDRFQAFQRGKFAVTLDSIEQEEVIFRQDETAVQCLGCHHVCLLPELLRP